MSSANENNGTNSNGNNGANRPRAEWIARRKAENTDGNFSQMRYARNGVITEEMGYVAWQESGFDPLAESAARARGIVITNARGVFSRPIAEYVMMMILAVSRKLPGLLELQRERTWQPLEGTELRDVTVGIIPGDARVSLSSADARFHVRSLGPQFRRLGCRPTARGRSGPPDRDHSRPQVCPNPRPRLTATLRSGG